MKALVRLLGFLARHPWQVALAITLGVGVMASNVGLLSVAAYLIAASALQLGLSQLTLPIFLVQIFGISRAAFRYTERLVSHNVTFRLLSDLRTWLYGRLESLSPARLIWYRSGDLLTRIVKDVEELENIYLRVVSPVVVAVVVSALTSLLLYAFASSLAHAALGFLVLAGVGVPLLVAALARRSGRRELDLRTELNTEVLDGIQGIQDLLILGQAAQQQSKISDLSTKLGRVQQKMASITGLQSALGDLTMNVAVWTVLILAIPLVTGGQIPPVYLAFLALVVLASFEAVQPLGTAFQFLGRSLGAGERLFEISDAEPQVRDPDKPIPIPSGSSLEFDRVGFRYLEDEPLVLNDVSTKVEPGRRIAIVGPSGSGKSTLANLALRFWDPTAGHIRLGDHDLREYALKDLRNTIGLVAQDTYLFNDSLRNNLLLARPEATDAELAFVLERVQLAELVRRLPGRLDTPLGEQGLRLSGGERQRLALARALLKDAPILILDEPTANLDPVTEQNLLSEIYELTQERATLTITHRLVHMECMDEIVVLDRGRIVERGTHKRLLERNSLYKQMVEVQNQMLKTV